MWSRDCLQLFRNTSGHLQGIVRVAQALVFCVVICKSLLLFLFIIFHLAIVLSVSDDHFGILILFVPSCMVLKETPVGCGGRTNAQITLRSAKYLHTIKYFLLHNFIENKPEGYSRMENPETLATLQT